MTMRPALLTLVLAASLLFVFPRAGVADPLQEAQRLYGASEYGAAERVLTRAIQATPLRRDLYLGLARTLNMLERFEEAAFVYQLFISHPRLAAGATQPSQRVLDEYAGVRGARENPDRAPEPPSSQEQALAAFEARLEQGPIVSGRAGDAWGFLETLLRTGFARPELHDLRVALAEALVEEITDQSPTNAHLLPPLSWEAWELQRLRVERLRTLEEALLQTDPDHHLPAMYLVMIDHIAEGQLLALQGDADASLAAFERATEIAPGNMPAWIGRLNAHLARGDGSERAAASFAGLRHLACERGEGLDVLIHFNARLARTDEAVRQAAEDVVFWLHQQTRPREERRPHPICSIQRAPR